MSERLSFWHISCKLILLESFVSCFINRGSEDEKGLSTLLVAALLFSQISVVQADQLQDVEKRGVLRVAVPQDFPPFGSVGTDLQPQGYDIDMAAYLAKQMKLKLQLVPVTSANRVPYLQTGKVDLVISSLGKNPEREKVIDFSRAYAPFFLGVFGAKPGR